MTIALASVLLCLGSSAWAGQEAPAQKKKFPHPHAVHLDIVEQDAPEFAVEDIASWPEFVRSLRSNLQLLSVRADVQRLVLRARPEAVSADEKAIVVGELNRLLTQPNAGIRRSEAPAGSSETKKAAAHYRKTQAPDDLRWLHRNMIGDLFPQITRKSRGSELPRITCATCHEGFVPADARGAAGLAAPEGDERAVAACVTKAVADRRSIQECLARAEALRAARVESRGPLTGIIQKRLAEGDSPFLATLRPEDPYTFKPLLKRLVCTGCHGQARTVDKVRGPQGELKGIPIFYGEGFRQIRPEDVPGAPGR
ncbi:MAG TPA: hypothetical protein VFO18_08860 [Methylomirabilota bacterium]|nr:hypothetical protein [Methylomirabilota bacterium]